MVLRAIFEEIKNTAYNEFHCTEISRVLHMDIPIALILRMPSTHHAQGFTEILLYFPLADNMVAYSCELLKHKFNIEKIVDINFLNNKREKIKEYKYVVELLPFLKPTEDGVYRYFIDFSLTGSRWVEVRIYYLNDDRGEEYLELWYYDDMVSRCKNPKKLGTWNYIKHEVNGENILIWETSDGKPLGEGLRLPHINGYHERDEGEDF